MKRWVVKQIDTTVDDVVTEVVVEADNRDDAITAAFDTGKLIGMDSYTNPLDIEAYEK